MNTKSKAVIIQPRNISLKRKAANFSDGKIAEIRKNQAAKSKTIDLLSSNIDEDIC
jgi:hypothetical protein